MMPILDKRKRSERKTMNKKCPQCRLKNPSAAKICVRCRRDLVRVSTLPAHSKKSAPTILMRVAVVVLLSIIGLGGFYYSMIFSSAPLTIEQEEIIDRAIDVLRAKGFADEVFYLEYLAAFRASDNWLNDSVVKENAYAATNYPFEIMTVYPDFFKYPLDDTERAAILLHEAKHLQGAGEKQAYSYVWAHRHKLGWTEEDYSGSVVWKNVRLQTIEYAPHLFE